MGMLGTTLGIAIGMGFEGRTQDGPIIIFAAVSCLLATTPMGVVKMISTMTERIAVTIV